MGSCLSGMFDHYFDEIDMCMMKVLALVLGPLVLAF